MSINASIKQSLQTFQCSEHELHFDQEEVKTLEVYQANICRFKGGRKE
jgi:hypothetical protein